MIINGDYEGDVDCGGRFEIGSTGRVKGQVKTQVLVVKEGAHWEGSVVMTYEAAAPRAAAPAQQASQGGKGQAAQPVSAGAASGQGSIFSKSEAAPSGDRTATGPGTGNNGVGPPGGAGERRRSWSRSPAGIASSRAIAAG